MIEINYITSYYPAQIASVAAFRKHILKEYIQLMVLDFLASSQYINKLAFIGGTNLRLIKGIDRFSEDLDFDCKNLSQQDFNEMADAVVSYLRNSGLRVESRDTANPRLVAFRKNIFFQEFLFELGLTGHRDERFLLKIEAQDQGTPYPVEMHHIQRCGFFFSLPTPPDAVLLSMKLSALLSRAKGRDFFDCMFLMQRTAPDYAFLKERSGLSDPAQMKAALLEKLSSVDLNIKKKDFEHLLLNPHSANMILRFREFIELNL